MRVRTRRGILLSALLCLFPAACASGGSGGGEATPGPAVGSGGVDSAPPIPPSIHWVRTSAEYRALFEQTYARAAEAVREASDGLESGSWGVIMDADETVLDNSDYQVRRARAGLGYTRESWNDWVREEAALLLPGAGRFVGEVRALGGLVFIVTNREDAVCRPTADNLAALGIRAAAVLCRAPGEEGKEGRFRAVEAGRAAPGVGPVTVLAWIGDNIRDFPGMAQEMRREDASSFDRFGTRYFIVPNPMYGSWESNPPRMH